MNTRSKRRCTLHPNNLPNASAGAKKTKPVEVIKHSKSNPQPIKKTAPPNPQDLPYFAIEEEDEDLEVVSAEVKFHPHRYNSSKKDSHEGNNEITAQNENADMFLFNKSKVPEKFQSEIPFKPPRAAPKLNKKTLKVTNKRSSSLTSSTSSIASSEYKLSSKKLKPSKVQSSKNPSNKKDVAIPNQPPGNDLKKSSEEQPHLNLTCDGCTQKQYVSASIKPGYAVITESYIRNLKDEIHSARSKPSTELTQTADQLKAEINQFRTCQEASLAPPQIRSTNTNVKITLPKDKFPNTLDLHITNSIHGGSLSCAPPSGVYEKSIITNAPSGVYEKRTITSEPSGFEKATIFANESAPTEREIVSTCLLPGNDPERGSFPESVGFSSQVASSFQMQIAGGLGNEASSRNSLEKQKSDYYIDTEIVVTLPPDIMNGTKSAQSVENEFRMVGLGLPEDENQSVRGSSGKGYDSTNKPDVVEKRSIYSNVSSSNPDMGEISHVSFKSEEVIKIEHGESPILPIIMNAVCSSAVSTSVRELDSEQSIERAYPKQIYSDHNAEAEERKYYMSLMKEHTQSVKILSSLLGEAQTTILEIANKLKNQDEQNKTKCTDKAVQLRSARELSDNEQASKHEHELKSFSEDEESYCSNPDAGTQVEKEDFSDKETVSDATTSVVEADDGIDTPEDDVAFEEVEDRSLTNLFDTSSLNERNVFLGYFTDRDVPYIDFHNLSVISERTEKSSSEEDSAHSTADKDLVVIKAPAGFICASHSSTKASKGDELVQSGTERIQDQLENNKASEKGVQPLKSPTPEKEPSIIYKEQAKLPESFCNDSNCSQYTTNEEATKGVKPLKVRATEVLISSMISQTDGQMRSAQQKATKDVQTKNKLSIQMMPSIDIRRGLVTQTIPTIIITPSESVPPPNVFQDSNVGYEVVRHVSSDTINACSAAKDGATFCIAEKCKAKYAKPSTDPQPEIQSKVSSVQEVPREIEPEHWNRDCEKGSADTMETEQSSVPACAHMVFGKEIPKEPADGTKFDVPITTFMNNRFKDESESETLIANEPDVEVHRTESNTTRKSIMSEFLGKTTCVKKYMNQMLKNPKTEAVLKSYQVIQEQSGHDPDEVLDDSHLSYIDTDVYKTFVNPEGLKLVRDDKHGISHSNLLLATPPEFYATKSVQCDARSIGSTGQASIVVAATVEVIEEKDKPIEEKVVTIDDRVVGEAKDPTEMDYENVSADSVSDTTNIWSIDDVSQSSFPIKNSAELPMPHKPDSPPPVIDAREIKQDRSYVSRNAKMQQSSSPRASIVLSHTIPIPRDVQMHLAKTANVNRNLHQRPSSSNRRPQQSGRILELAFPRSVKRETEHSHQLKSSHTNPSPSLSKDSLATNESLKSDTTADLIFQINRASLRSRTHLSRMDFVPSSETLQARSASGIAVEVANGKEVDPEGASGSSAGTTSEYVITHDVSLQTSVTNDNLPQSFSKHRIDSSIEKLKQIVGEDIQSEGDVATVSCCPGLRRNKKRVNSDAYMKVQPTQTVLAYSSPAPAMNYYDHRGSVRSVRLEVADVPPVFKPQFIGSPERTPRHMSRRGASPVGSFIEGLTSHNKNEIINAKNAPPRNDTSVFQRFSSAEIISAIKRATDSWKEIDKRQSYSGTETSLQVSQASTENIRLSPDDFAREERTERLFRKGRSTDIENNASDKTRKNNSDESGNDADDVSVSKLEAYTIMTVNVKHAGVMQDQQFSKKTPEKPSPNSSPLQRNVPGGDEPDYCADPVELGQFPQRHARHEGIFARNNTRRQKQINKIYDSSSSSQPTTCDSSEKTDGNLSEGEIRCKCSASIGEVHVCPFGRTLKPAQSFRRNSQNLIKREFGSPHAKIKWKKEYNSNWVAYYVSRSPSPELDNSEVADNSSSMDSSGIVRK